MEFNYTTVNSEWILNKGNYVCDPFHSFFVTETGREEEGKKEAIRSYDCCNTIYSGKGIA